MYVSTNVERHHNVYEHSGHGSPVVLIHALGGSMRSWAPVVDALSTTNQVIAYDWRRHGRSEKSLGKCSLPLLAEDLVGPMSAVGMGRACLVGVAIGALIALQTPTDYPDRVVALILADEGCSETDAVVAENTGGCAETVEREGMRVAVDTSVERSFPQVFREGHAEVIHEYRGDFLANYPHSYASALRILIGLNLTPRLSVLRCPTLLLAGELDSHFPPTTSRFIQERITGARLETLPGVRHFSNIEAPELIAQHVLEFLAGLDSDSNAR